MESKLNLSQLVDLFAKASGMSKNKSEQFLRSFFDLISNNVLENEIVKVKGLGTFKSVQMENRASVDVNTGKRIIIEGHKKISFIPDTSLKESINKPFSAFEVTEITEEQAKVLEEDTLNEKQIQSETHTNKIIVTPQKSNTYKSWLRVALYSASTILVILLMAYILWPLNLLGFLRLNDNGQNRNELLHNAEVIEPEIVPSEILPDSMIKQLVDIKDTIEKTPKNLANKPVSIPIKTLELTAGDKSKDLTQFSVADTVNYKMTGLKAEHVLKEGETLTMVALKYYGTKKLWPYIAAYNNLSNFNILKAGIEIKVPVIENRL